MSILDTLIQEARNEGWASAVADLPSLRREAESRGWFPVPIRRGEAEVAELRPVAQDQAHPRSLSAVVGLGAQPLHTDGAHLRRPPDWVVLFSAAPNSVPTYLWKGTWPGSSSAKHGLFTVKGGNTSFYATAFDANYGYRFDPGCMTPVDEDGIAATHEFEEALKKSKAHEWSKEGMVLLIDNRRALHARGAVGLSDSSRVVRRLAFNEGGVR